MKRLHPRYTPFYSSAASVVYKGQVHSADTDVAVCLCCCCLSAAGAYEWCVCLPACLSACLPACPCDTQGAQRCNRRSRQGAGDTARKVRGEWPLVEGAWTRSSAQFSECSETNCRRLLNKSDASDEKKGCNDGGVRKR